MQIDINRSINDILYAIRYKINYEIIIIIRFNEQLKV